MDESIRCTRLIRHEVSTICKEICELKIGLIENLSSKFTDNLQPQYRISSNLMRTLFSADFEKNNFSIFLFSAGRCPVRTKCLLIDLNVCVLMRFDCFNRSNLVRFFLKKLNDF